MRRCVRPAPHLLALLTLVTIVAGCSGPTATFVVEARNQGDTPAEGLLSIVVSGLVTNRTDVIVFPGGAARPIMTVPGAQFTLNVYFPAPQGRIHPAQMGIPVNLGSCMGTFVLPLVVTKTSLAVNATPGPPRCETRS